MKRPHRKLRVVTFPTGVIVPRDRLMFLWAVEGKLQTEYRQAGLSRLGQRAAWEDWMDRLVSLHAAASPLRRLVYPDWGVRMDGPKGPDPALTGERQGARESRVFDSVLSGYPLLERGSREVTERDPVENFAADYIEYDNDGAGGHLVAGVTTIAVTAMTRDEDSYVYKDFGAGHFAGDYQHLYGVHTASAGNTGQATCHLGQNVDDFYNATDACGGTTGRNGANACYVGIVHKESTVTQDSDATASNLNDTTWHDIVYERNAEVATAVITESANGAVDSLEMADTDAVARRYSFGVASRDENLGASTLSYAVRNLDLQETIARPKVGGSLGGGRIGLVG